MARMTPPQCQYAAKLQSVDSKNSSRCLQHTISAMERAGMTGGIGMIVQTVVVYRIARTRHACHAHVACPTLTVLPTALCMQFVLPPRWQRYCRKLLPVQHRQSGRLDAGHLQVPWRDVVQRLPGSSGTLCPCCLSQRGWEPITASIACTLSASISLSISVAPAFITAQHTSSDQSLAPRAG